MTTTLLLFLISGCGTDAEDTADDGAGDSHDSPAPLAPQPGTYAVSAEPVIDDGCGIFEDNPDGRPTEGDRTAVVFSDTDGTVSFEDPDSSDDEPLVCDFASPDFTCELEGFVQDLADYGMDAVITVVGTMDGAWTADTVFDSAASFTTTCEGDDCGDVADMGVPIDCTTGWSFTAELQAE